MLLLRVDPDVHAVVDVVIVVVVVSVVVVCGGVVAVAVVKSVVVPIMTASGSIAWTLVLVIVDKAVTSTHRLRCQSNKGNT